MKKSAPHPDSKPPVHKVQHSDTYKVSQYGSEKMNVVLFYRSSEARPPPNHLGLDFHIIGIYTYVVRTFLICVRVLVICDRNSIATKLEEFPARLVEVASSRLYFASRVSLLQLLQQTYSALCQQPVWKSV